MGHRAIKPQIKQDAGRLIEKFITVHENDVTALALVELFHEPCPCCAGNLACGNQVKVIQQYLPVCVGIEDRMIDCHSRLIEHRGDVVISTRSAGINLVTLYLSTEIYPVARGQLVFHP
jgi:hypothetical protein